MIAIYQFVRLLLVGPVLANWIAWLFILVAEAASVWFRREGLLAVCAVAAVLAVSPVTFTSFADISLFAIGYLCATTPAWIGIGAGAVTALSLIYGFYLAEEDFNNSFGAILYGVIPIAVGLTIAYNRRLLEMEQVRRRLQLAQQSQDFATEVHDSISHVLVQISILSEAKLSTVAQDQADHLEQINGLSARGLREMRDLVKELQSRSQQWALLAGGEKAPQMIEDTADACVNSDFGSVLQEFSDALQRAGFTLELQIQGDTESVPPSTATVLADCLREISTNIMKYADATQPVALLLRINASRVRLYCANEVKDGGANFPSSGHGLVGIKRRVESLGGQVETALDDATWSITIGV
ncbi:MAG: histidine kinase [Mobiluncus porci]|nr:MULTISPECIES: histidine kinase [Mobiluncus]MCI6583932.1 histidine kinase [Mobiluncus sp.]MDD7542381.1 histidine kinase [Mobiluncus porci]MDY5747690.1 histidine kinase [Mobiluncus porci]